MEIGKEPMCRIDRGFLTYKPFRVLLLSSLSMFFHSSVLLVNSIQILTCEP